MNIPVSIKNKMNKNIYMDESNPICMMKNHILNFFNSFSTNIEIYENIDPIVSVYDNFDSLLIPDNHPARSKSDTFYFDEKNVLRTHTTCHQTFFLKKNTNKNYIIIGDVYRKDEIDRYHYPVFHQLEGIFLSKEDPVIFLKNLLIKLVEYLFPNLNYKINDDYFPFTDNSLEIEIEKDGKYVEILGGGVIKKDILRSCNNESSYIAFGIGLERLCMIYFGIPDIRYFWNYDPKFLDQFKNKKINEIKFINYSNLHNQYSDLSFYINKNDIISEKWILENDFYEIIRNHSEDYIESVSLKDKYVNKNNDVSLTYRLTFSPNAECKNISDFTNTRNIITKNIIENIKILNVTLR